jgi:uncharacterized protein YdhG (YjbR/CyaY superfamily)
VKEYLDELPPERREVIAKVRQAILENLPAGYEESMNWGMISYEIPLERYPDTYNGQPLGYVALAAQKRHYSLYLMNVYQDSEKETFLKRGFEEAGKKLDMGKSCVRFKKLDDLPIEVIAEIISSTTPEQYIADYEKIRQK